MPVNREVVRNVLLLVGGASLLVFALKLIGILFEFGVNFDIKIGSL